ncbi:YhgE/Pip family protein [Bacillus sp. N9]
MIAIVGIVQSLLAVAIMLFGLHMEVKSIPLFIITTIATSLSFIALIQFLVTLFADPGRFIAIIILILQLTTSAGTFPLELIPNGLQPFNAMLPMTYSVQAYKAVISSGDFSYMWKNISILSAYLIGFMGLTIGYFQYKFKRSFEYKVSE